MASGHDKIEKNIGLMIILIIITVSIGGLVQIVPLFFQQSTTEAVAGLEPYTPLRLPGVTCMSARAVTCATRR